MVWFFILNSHGTLRKQQQPFVCGGWAPQSLSVKTDQFGSKLIVSSTTFSSPSPVFRSLVSLPPPPIWINIYPSECRRWQIGSRMTTRVEESAGSRSSRPLSWPALEGTQECCGGDRSPKPSRDHRMSQMCPTRSRRPWFCKMLRDLRPKRCVNAVQHGTAVGYSTHVCWYFYHVFLFLTAFSGLDRVPFCSQDRKMMFGILY